MLSSKKCKAGCMGCYYEDKDCPEQESGKPVKEWTCVKNNCIYIEKDEVEQLKN